jgi:hypothetical protein
MRIILAVLALSTIGCSTIGYVSPIEQKDKNVEMVYIQGEEVGVSDMSGSRVAFYGMKEKKTLEMFVFVKNYSDKDVNVIPENIEIYKVGEDGSRSQIKTYEPNEYIRLLQRQHNTALMFSALGKAMEDINAGESTSTVSGTGSDAYGTYTYGGTVTTTDYGEKARANSENNAQISQEARQAELLRTSVKNGLLLKTTLFPDAYISGNVMFKYKSGSKFIMKVPVGDEIHEVWFTIKS